MNRDDLETLLRGAREPAPPEAPSFRRVWSAALARREARRPRRRLVQAAVGLSAAALLLAVLMSVPRLRTPTETSEAFDPEARALARSLSDWRGPLDFLLEPPGGHLFGLDPRASTLPFPTELSTEAIEEVL